MKIFGPGYRLCVFGKCPRCYKLSCYAKYFLIALPTDMVVNARVASASVRRHDLGGRLPTRYANMVPTNRNFILHLRGPNNSEVTIEMAKLAVCSTDDQESHHRTTTVMKTLTMTFDDHQIRWPSTAPRRPLADYYFIRRKTANRLTVENETEGVQIAVKLRNVKQTVGYVLSEDASNFHKFTLQWRWSLKDPELIKKILQ